MSLTSLLKRKNLKEAFKQQFPVPKLDQKLGPGQAYTKNYALLGTAFDYALRFLLQKRFAGQVEVITSPWVAEHALQRCSPLIEDTLNSLVSRAKSLVGNYLQPNFLSSDLDFSEALLQSCLHLAQCDQVFRSGGRADIEAGPSCRADIDDLALLVDNAIRSTADWTVQSRLILNPTFGEASELVGALMPI
jgi:hypothetical protein